MMEQDEPIVVGVLGQWASGKTAAARALVSHLGGEEETIFITDRELISGQAVEHIRALGDAGIIESIEADGRRRLESDLVTVWLNPGEDLDSVDLESLDFYADQQFMPEWHRRARVELGRQICQKLDEGKPIVIEAAFGPDVPGPGDQPLILTIADLFLRLAEAGLAAGQIKWILVEADYEKRAERNRKRQDTIPADIFHDYAPDGGDLTPRQQTRLERRGATIRRVANNHDDLGRFKADVVAELESITG